MDQAPRRGDGNFEMRGNCSAARCNTCRVPAQRPQPAARGGPRQRSCLPPRQQRCDAAPTLARPNSRAPGRPAVVAVAPRAAAGGSRKRWRLGGRTRSRAPWHGARAPATLAC
eukprot:9820361-Alexandrium_andersonii.AAC.1